VEGNFWQDLESIQQPGVEGGHGRLCRQCERSSKSKEKRGGLTYQGKIHLKKRKQLKLRPQPNDPDKEAGG